MGQPNILFVMTDQQRFDTIAALGNLSIHTPNIDRLVRRGISFSRAYSSCPVCVAARYSIHTGCKPPATRVFNNAISPPAAGQAGTVEGRCGPYLPKVMRGLGYRTFGIGKFHTRPDPFEDLGYDLHLHTEEMWDSPDERLRDAYAGWIAREHPEYDFIEQLHGERTEMYYMPQMSPLPAGCTVESFVADRAAELLAVRDSRPFFGFVSFIGPHPPFAPPIPFNRMYDPDRVPNPIRGERAIDLMDDYLPWMNHLIWAEDISDGTARVLKARYYGEISYIDSCLGRILDAVEARPDTDNTLICFFSDHGDHLGDHHSWQKEGFFEASCHVPFLLSWPARLPAGAVRPELVSLADLCAIATSAAGACQRRDGIDVLGMLRGAVPAREHLFSIYGVPGERSFKIMVRDDRWKYIYLANGGREQLFDLHDDPQEHKQRLADRPEIARRLRAAAIRRLRCPGAADALGGDDLKALPFEPFPRRRVYQMADDRGVTGFPRTPAEVVPPSSGSQRV